MDVCFAYLGENVHLRKKKMNILRLATFAMSILLALMTVTATWMVLDTYQRYGSSWQVTTIIQGKNETHTETIASQVFSLLFLVALTVLGFANFHNQRKKHPQVD